MDDLAFVAASLGKSGLYHETITVAYLLLIRERMERGNEARFEEFAARNTDLLCWRPSVLERYYREDTLASDLARRCFVLPDRLAGPSAGEPGPTVRGQVSPGQALWGRA